jgi:hypothetical protein
VYRFFGERVIHDAAPHPEAMDAGHMVPGNLFTKKTQKNFGSSKKIVGKKYLKRRGCGESFF